MDEALRAKNSDNGSDKDPSPPPLMAGLQMPPHNMSKPSLLGPGPSPQFPPPPPMGPGGPRMFPPRGRPPFMAPNGGGPPPPFFRGGPPPGRMFRPPMDMPSRSVEPDNFGMPGCVVSLGNLPYEASTDDIIEFFADRIKITQEQIIRRFTDTGRATGDARVCFASREEAEKACTLNRSVLKGRDVIVKTLH